MKLIFFALLWSLPAQAMVFPIFNRDGQSATLMLTGMGQDMDAFRFYSALNVPREEEQGKWTKKVALVDQAGVKTFTAVCVFSKLVETNGSCTLVLRASTNTAISLNNKTASFDITGGPDLEIISRFFVIPDQSGDFYRSSNNRLALGAVRDSGTIVRVYLHYQ